MELEVVHRLTNKIADIKSQSSIVAVHKNRSIAAAEESKAMKSALEAGTVDQDRLLDARRRVADAGVAYGQAVKNLQIGFVQLNRETGELLADHSVEIVGPTQ